MDLARTPGPGAPSHRDFLFLLSLDLRTSRDDPPDPLSGAARWLWHELRDREYRRDAARAALERAWADPPQLIFGSTRA
jgi:hypothetical protein